MSSTAALIHAEFGEECNLYEVLGIESNATDKEITRAYRKLALRYHPDKHRGDEASKAKSTTKFQAISAIHSLLSDAESRAFYDETGSILSSDHEQSPSFQMWVEYFARIFPKVTEEDIVKFESEYRFSEEERRDVVEAYTKFNGNMQNLMDSIMLSTDDDEERFVKIIEDAIKNKEVKSFPKWREYMKKKASKPKKPLTAAQQMRKQAKKEQEAREAEELFNKIRQNQQKRSNGSSETALSAKREQGFESLISSLEAKYADKSSSRPKKKSRKTPAGDPFENEPSEEQFLAAQKRLKTKQKK